MVKNIKLFAAALMLSTFCTLIFMPLQSSGQPTKTYDLSKVRDLKGKFKDKRYQSQWQLEFSNIESYKKHIDRKQFLKRIYDEQINKGSSERDKILSIIGFVQRKLYAPEFTPIDEDKMAIYDPLILYDIRWSSCGQTNRFLVDLLTVGGHEANLLQLNGHVAASVKLDGKWRFLDADALTSDIYIKNLNGDLATIDEVVKQPELTINTPINWERHITKGSAADTLDTYQSLDVFKSVEIIYGGKKLITPYFWVKNTKSKNFTYKNRYYGWNYFIPEIIN